MVVDDSASELSFDELKFLRQLNRDVDELLEESLRLRESVSQAFRRALPRLVELTGAKAVAITTLNEDLKEETFASGSFPLAPANLLLAHGWGVHRVGDDTFVSQSLDVVGIRVGTMGLLYEGDQSARAQPLLRVLETVAEELDTVLSSVQTAAEKHQITVRINQLLSNRVFETGMDQAVLALAERVRLPGFMLLYRDAVTPGRLHYRVYRFGHLEYESSGKRFPGIEAAIERFGPRLVTPDDTHVRDALGEQRAVESVLISGASRADSLGKILIWSGADGFSAFTMDLIRLLSATLSQRLVDYNRERIHLSQFFAAPVIDELLRDPEYEKRYLAPREEEVGILFADINGFTRICEQVLEKPGKIGQFVDDWSQETVAILWRNGGVFDKMVGDCVIGLFGPPFFRSSRLERAEGLLRSAQEIQQFTRERMNSHPEVARISELIALPGLGVAIGANLAHTFCGLFGPNRQYTGFSTGMNQTARLQSLGGFRETLVMESVHKALSGTADPALKALKYGPLVETPVKNVAAPLRYFKLLA